MPKLIDAEAAKAAIEKLIEATQATRRLALEAGFREAALGASYCYGTLKEILTALDALPDASEKAIHAERIPVPPHLAEAQRVVIARAAKSQKSEWSRQHIDQWRKGSENEAAQPQEGE